MTTLEKIVENLRMMPESFHAEVLSYVEYLKSKEFSGGEWYNWQAFSLESAMRGIGEEYSMYDAHDIKEQF